MPASISESLTQQLRKVPRRVDPEGKKKDARYPPKGSILITGEDRWRRRFLQEK